MQNKEIYFNQELPLLTIGATLDAVSRIERQERERIAQERERIRVKGFFQTQENPRGYICKETRQQLNDLDANEKRLAEYFQRVKQFLLTLKP